MDSFRLGGRDFLYHVSFFSILLLSCDNVLVLLFIFQGHTEAKEETEVYVGQEMAV
jgi:hypothetical protein